MGLRFQRGLDLVLKHLPEEASVLECNAGQQFYSKAFVQSGAKLTVLELDPSVIQQKNDYAHEEYRTSIEEAIIPYRSQSAIWLYDVLSTYPRNSLLRLLHRIQDWLEIDGVIYLCFPEGEGEMVRQSRTPYGAQSKLTVFYQADELAEIMRLAQLSVVDAWRSPIGDYQFIHMLVKND